MDGNSSDSSTNAEQEMNNYKLQVQENSPSNYVMQNSNANSFETYDNYLPRSTTGDKNRKKDEGNLRSKKQKTAAPKTLNEGRGKRDTKPQRRLAQNEPQATVPLISEDDYKKPPQQTNFPAATSAPRNGTNQFVNDNDISYIPGPSNKMQNLDDMVTDISDLDCSNVTLRPPKYKSTSFANECNSRSGKDDIMSIVNNIAADDTEKINEQANERYERGLLNNHSIHEVVDSVIVIDNSSLQMPMNYDTPIAVSSDDPVSFVDLPSTKKSSLVEPAPKPVAEVSHNQSKTNIDHSNIKEQDPEENSQSTNDVGFCPICLESLANTSISSTTCGHIFCTSCIKTAVKSHRKCPICRKKLTLKKIHPLFI